jgi:V8-like Glu-specific endopeptidase
MAEAALPPLLLLLALAAVVNAAADAAASAAAPAGEPLLAAAARGGRLRVPPGASAAAPFSSVGQLESGCSAFFIGRCAALTVGHCVYEPKRGIWWPGTTVHAGRNAPAWSPFGAAPVARAEVSAAWQARGDPAADVALLLLADGRAADAAGWLPLASCGEQAAALDAALASGEAVLSVAGYPDDRENGTMWAGACGARRWRDRPSALGGGGSRGVAATSGSGGVSGGAGGSSGSGTAGLIEHDCGTRGGDSGAPLWVTTPADKGSRRTPLAMHIAAEKAAEGGRREAAGRRPTPLAVPLVGELCEWLAQRVAAHEC